MKLVIPLQSETPTWSRITALVCGHVSWRLFYIDYRVVCFCPNLLLHSNWSSKLTEKLTDQSQFQSKGLNYGFVEYDDPGAAERAMSTLNGRRVHQSVSHRIPHLDAFAYS